MLKPGWFIQQKSLTAFRVKSFLEQLWWFKVLTPVMREVSITSEDRKN